jgi:hypothetical protein
VTDPCDGNDEHPGYITMENILNSWVIYSSLGNVSSLID